MRLVLTFWTKPALQNLFDIDHRFRKDIFIIALSCWYAKNSGANLTMYTDDFGLQMLDHLPYDDIVVNLNNINVNFNVFAYPKFVATKDLPLGIIHIDNDVFIKSEKCLEALNFDGYDCIVQSKDFIKNSGLHINTKRYYLRELSDLGYGDILTYPYEFNTGVIGFNNKKLKSEYINTYFNLIKNAHYKIKKEIPPDIIFEQSVLYKMGSKYKVKILLQNINPDDINYQHVLSVSKWKNIDKIKDLLKYYSPELYSKTVEKVKKFKL